MGSRFAGVQHNASWSMASMVLHRRPPSGGTDMSRNTSKQTATARGVALSCLAVAFLAAGVRAGAQSNDFTERAGLVGTWMVRVTLRDCTTGAPLGPPFSSLVTFHGDGTLSESPASLAFAPGQRGPGHGTWTRKRRHSFQQEMIALVLFDTEPNLPATPTFDPTKPVSPGFLAGWQTVSHTVRFTAPDQIASTGTNRFYRTNGEAYRSGCSDATAQRFQ
jgi:hypothetical protein